MTDRTEGELAQVAALDEERRRYEAWLAQLDARRGTAPEHVLERVRVDYEGRLRDVVGRLAEHAEMLRGVVAERSRDLAAIRDAERQRQDERAEAELRAMVGEYTPEQWQEIEAQSTLALEELGARRSAAEAELARLEEVHALAATGGAPVPEAGGRWSDAPPTEAAGGASTSGAGTRGVGTRDAGPSGTRGAGPALTPPPADAPDGFDDWDEEPAPLADAGRPAGGAPVAAERPRERGGWVTSDEAAAEAHVPAAGGSAPARGHSAADTGGAPAKTLRCAECGTMNYPTEWYCERCGGELAAL
jgi:hypothetical protein